MQLNDIALSSNSLSMNTKLAVEINAIYVRKLKDNIKNFLLKIFGKSLSGAQVTWLFVNVGCMMISHAKNV